MPHRTLAEIAAAATVTEQQAQAVLEAAQEGGEPMQTHFATTRDEVGQVRHLYLDPAWIAQLEAVAANNATTQAKLDNLVRGIVAINDSLQETKTVLEALVAAVSGQRTGR